jgi:hypothetical protein
MATATFTPTLSTSAPPDVTDTYVHYFGTLAISAAADTYLTGGLVCSFAGIKLDSSAVPTEVRIWDETAGVGLVYQYCKGTKLSDGKVVIRGQYPDSGIGAGKFPLPEVANALALNDATLAIDTAAAAGKLTFEAIFRKGK